VNSERRDYQVGEVTIPKRITLLGGRKLVEWLETHVNNPVMRRTGMRDARRSAGARTSYVQVRSHPDLGAVLPLPAEAAAYRCSVLTEVASSGFRRPNTPHVGQFRA
jgi:hypothetical protein